MSGQDSSSARLPSDYSSELHGAAPALVSSGGSVHTENTPTTSSSSGPDQAPNTVRVQQDVSSPARLRQMPTGNADAELNRRLAEHDQGARRGTDRERSRGHRGQAQHHAISTPVHSRPSTPRRGTPVAPITYADRISDLQGEVFELSRRLRHTEAHAYQHEHMVEQQASESMAAV